MSDIPLPDYTSRSSSKIAGETIRMHNMYVVDPETNTSALPYRTRNEKLEKLYRRACCGSVAGILLWIVLLLVAIFVPIGVLLAKGQLGSHSPQQLEPAPSTLTSWVFPSTASSTALVIAISPGMLTTTETVTSVPMYPAISTETVTSVVTSISVSIVTYSGPSIAVTMEAVTTTDIETITATAKQTTAPKTTSPDERSVSFTTVEVTTTTVLNLPTVHIIENTITSTGSFMVHPTTLSATATQAFVSPLVEATILPDVTPTFSLAPAVRPTS
ncbi:hypothetical protein G647_01084 [Cladophialophora carrionii CBS 160.54]|uniref:Uncharacterized protein n=1 Tax=Cladophialophora carrionii CBS 160.54 TaxID=1279043 RepID=V9DQP4_9EURO|nr:uncharacterized protein G647_01084 [Cladophialophora carrionii CBS 160.54]ETI28633.1 hypothetical protein G647_01084 [Cladophialophora carrionii CBS 160.54]